MGTISKTELSFIKVLLSIIWHNFILNWNIFIIFSYYFTLSHLYHMLSVLYKSSYFWQKFTLLNLQYSTTTLNVYC